MNFKTRIKNLIAVILLSMGIIACDNTPDYSGTYLRDYDTYTSGFKFEKINNNKYKLMSVTDNKVDLTTIANIKDEKYVYVDGKNNAIGEFKDNEYIHYSDNLSYTKTK